MTDRNESYQDYDPVDEQRRRNAEAKRSTFDGAGLSPAVKRANNLITGLEFDTATAEELANQPHVVFIAGPWIITAEDIATKVGGVKAGLVDALSSIAISGRFGFPSDVFSAKTLTSSDKEIPAQQPE